MAIVEEAVQSQRPLAPDDILAELSSVWRCAHAGRERRDHP